MVEHFNELRAELAVADGVTASKRLTELDAAAAVLDGLVDACRSPGGPVAGVAG